jgi:AbrB family looped-hinge helix DNA binding protein
MPLPITTVSTKGQVILPKTVRDSRQWSPGTKLVVEERADGVFLRAVKEKRFPPTKIEDVFGSLKYEGPPMTVEEMDEALGKAVAEDWARFERG